jgi:hypothetical protein
VSPPQAPRPKEAPAKPQQSAPQAFPVQPFKPRRTLFITLLMLFVVWVLVLVTMYFRTVYPLRHAAPATAPIKLAS